MFEARGGPFKRPRTPPIPGASSFPCVCVQRPAENAGLCRSRADSGAQRHGAAASGSIPRMRIAALYDIHGNLPALDAVLAEVDLLDVDAIVVGGDVVPGPMMAETVARLRELGDRAHLVMGNGDREVIAAFDAGPQDDGQETSFSRFTAWAAARLDRADRDFLAAFAPVVHLEVDDLGPTLFCHGSPRSDTEMITAVTPPERLAPMLADVAERVVVCGHTHHQFALDLDGRRVLNAGSVGMPYQGAAAAFWLLLGPEAEWRRTDYDVDGALETLRATGAPDVDEVMLRQSLEDPVTADEVARYFEDLAARGGLESGRG
jgi:predicted phosphodiesterase